MKYRPEIDGLRALAVVPVILFHAGFRNFSGGFVGVDVFFVISGYLITSIIIADLDNQRFSLIDFYDRRARRILPAMFFIMAICIPTAWIVMLPQDIKSFSQSLVAVSTFSSNFLFWRQSGYFDGAAELKPLLHTWSLAVEEQYYIVFPVLIGSIWSLGKRRLMLLLGLFTFASLGLAEWLIRVAPDAAFYLLPTRGWEILLGAMAALYLGNSNGAHRPSAFNQGFSVLGLAFLLLPVFLYTEKTPFPGLFALVPAAGALLIILYAVPGTFAHQILSSKIVVGLGLISYSAYLWHQPMFAFARYAVNSEPSVWLMGGLSILTIPLSYATWRLIESPFRKRKGFSRQIIFGVGGTTAAFFAAFGLLGHFNNGFEELWLKSRPADIRTTYALIKAVSERENPQDDGNCRFNVPNLGTRIAERILRCASTFGKGVAVVGDSHAIDLFGVVTTSNPNSPFIVGLTNPGCRPHTSMSGCQYQEFLEFVRANPLTFKRIIFEQAGFYLLKKDQRLESKKLFTDTPLWQPVEGVVMNRENIRLVERYLNTLAESTSVLWFGPRVEPHISKEHMLRKGCGARFELRKHQYDVFLELDKVIEEEVAKSAITFISQNKAFAYDFSKDLLDCTGLYWSDGDHLSWLGELRFGRRFNLLHAELK